ncbi:gns1 sur4 family protein [Phlyctema vagabunda]|uniref:Elongation of fatty acids protein n=1 Tax=Phlyctema vagabunda TaxID=108571 RepID=A0ABR4PNI0_9HELO
MASVHAQLPSSSLFTFPPSNDPQTLPPPPAGSTLSAPPFSIPAPLYNQLLDVKVPITIACVYAVTVTILNAYNKSTGNKPWAISKTRIFFWFVVAHNVFLAVYSGWTFVGMLQALQRSLASPNAPAGLAGTVDSLCKIHGTAGLGNAIAYNATLNGWVSESPSEILLSDAGTPFDTDLGRLWNEGLAFFGWFFYLSKFYEVLDTLIILAKGKKSSTLQTYHHAGAMMCMWAGIRFMSPPIWMFVFVNSGIHALMYTYYTLTAFSVPIPNALKRSLTTMQIIQFLVGASYAALHSFVSYRIPVQVPTGVVEAATSAVSSVAAVASSAGVGSLVKKFLFRAAGEEGLAENVEGVYPADQVAHHGAVHEEISHAQQYRTVYQTVPCIDTSGQTFAIWLNVFYLTPLTWLFVRFFIRSYIRRTGHGGKGATGTKPEAVNGAGKDALKGVERRIVENGGMNGKQNGHH